MSRWNSLGCLEALWSGRVPEGLGEAACSPGQCVAPAQTAGKGAQVCICRDRPPSPLRSGSWAPGPPWRRLRAYNGSANRLDTPSWSRLSPPPYQLLLKVSQDTPRLLHTPPGSECSGVPRIPASESPGSPHTLGLQRRWRQTWDSPGSPRSWTEPSFLAGLPPTSSRHTLPAGSLRASPDSAF